MKLFITLQYVVLAADEDVKPYCVILSYTICDWLAHRIITIQGLNKINSIITRRSGNMSFFSF